MLFRHIFTISSENHTKPTNTHGQNADVFNVKADVTCSYDCAL